MDNFGYKLIWTHFKLNFMIFPNCWGPHLGKMGPKFGKLENPKILRIFAAGRSPVAAGRRRSVAGRRRSVAGRSPVFL